MQWVIDAWCKDDRRSQDAVINRRRKRPGMDETRRMHYCKSCNCAWEPDRDVPRYLQKYRDFPKMGLKRKECKYCE